MGYSMTQKTWEKLQRLEAEGRRCKLDRCTQRATYALAIKSVDYDAQGQVKFPITAAKPAEEMGFCKRCRNKQIAAFEAHSQRNADGNLEYRVDFGPGQGYQTSVLLSERQLGKDERL